MAYYIIENQHRPDGVTNNSTVTRENINSANSYFYERLSKMSMTELYKYVAVTLLDENLAEIDRRIVKTMYVEPVQETENYELSE